jgi:hypothetical protein
MSRPFCALFLASQAQVHVAAVLRALLGDLGLHRNATVGRSRDERRAIVLGHLAAALVPEFVVREHTAVSARRVAGARLSLFRVEQVAVLTRVFRGFERRPLLVGQDGLAGELLGPLERRNRGEVEGAFERWLAVGRPGRLRRLTLRRGRQRERHDGQHGQTRSHQAITHKHSLNKSVVGSQSSVVGRRESAITPRIVTGR